MNRLLVTGGAGFIGANFVNYWLRRHPGDTVVVLDVLTHAGDIGNLALARKHSEYTFVRGNICDTPLVENLMRLHRVDTLVHFAAESGVDQSMESTDAFVRTNIVGTHSLLKAARAIWLDHNYVPTHRFHHVSTDEVYGSLGPDDAPCTEETPYAPNSPFSASKAAADHLVRAYHQTYGLNTTISICSNNYGPLQCPEELIPLIIMERIEGRRVSVCEDGQKIRNWLHVEDHCRGIDAVLHRGRAGCVYHIGGRVECDKTGSGLVRMLCNAVDEQLTKVPNLRAMFPGAGLIDFVENRTGHQRRHAIDCSKIQRECEFIPEIGLEAGLAATVAWYLDRVQHQRDGRRATHAVGKDAA